MTIILRGNESFFNLPGTSDFTLELEDVLTIHFMETDPFSHFEAAKTLIQSGGAFSASTYIATQRVSLVVDQDLINICPFTMIEGVPCVMRRDIQARGFPTVIGAERTAMEVNGSEAPAAEFMTRILGGSEYSAQLGANYSGIIQDRYNLNGKHRRAWWINPGFVWNRQQYTEAGDDRYTVSQKLIVAFLVGMDEHGGGRRRQLLVSEVDVGAGTSSPLSVMLDFRVDAASVVASALGLPVSLASTWRVALRLTHDQVCSDPAALQLTLEDKMLSYFTKCSSPLKALKVVKRTIERNGESCGRRAGSVAPFSAATVEMEIVVVFRAVGDMRIDKGLFLEMPGVLSLTAIHLADNVVIDQSYVSSDPPTQGDDLAALEGGTSALKQIRSSMFYIIVAVMGGVFLLLLIIVCTVVRRRNLAKMRNAERKRELNVAAANFVFPRTIAPPTRAPPVSAESDRGFEEASRGYEEAGLSAASYSSFSPLAQPWGAYPHSPSDGWVWSDE